MNPSLALSELRELVVNNIKELRLRAVVNMALNDPKFQQGWGSSGQHHAYPGGLVVHTQEVVREARLMFENHGGLVIDLEDLTVAAILHDYGKIGDYDGKTGETTSYRNLVRHVSGSHAFFVENINRVDRSGSVPFSYPRKNHIEHMILSHHGRQEWGSPVEPQTLAAHCLHYADMLSSLYGPGRKPLYERQT